LARGGWRVARDFVLVRNGTAPDDGARGVVAAVSADAVLRSSTLLFTLPSIGIKCGRRFQEMHMMLQHSDSRRPSSFDAILLSCVFVLGSSLVGCPNANPLFTGACCFGDANCQTTTADACDAAGGTFQGVGSACDASPCLQPTAGACCLPDTTCQVLPPEDCDTVGGTFQGAGTTCDVCQGTGACCLPDGSCLVLFEEACTIAGGAFQGIDVNCELIQCQESVTGACCFANGTCQQLTLENCAAALGIFQGDGTACIGVVCP
jgi:hypothetical protein